MKTQLTKKIYYFILIIIGMFSTTPIFAQQVWQPFSIAWQTTFGGNNIERNDYMGKTVAPAADGGYLSAANTYSDNLTGYHGEGDILATKVNSSGNILWQKCYGGSAHDELHSVINTTDGGFLIMATTSSTDGDIASFNHGGDDVWLVKIDSNGNIQWSKCYGGSDLEIYVTGLQNANGTYMITTCTLSNDGDVNGNHGGFDGLLMKINSNGNLMWRKCYGGTGDEYVDGLAIIKMQGGGYLLSFNTYSQDGDVATAGFHTGFDEFEGDAWIIRINDNGNIQWSKCFGGEGDDWFRHITQFSNGDIVATGFTYGSEATGDMPGSHGDYDWWVARISSTGNLIWSRQYGGSLQEAVHNQAFEYSNGEILLPSGTNSNDGDVSGNSAGKALWIMKTDAEGNMLGYNIIGSVGYNQFAGGILNSDGSLVINGMQDTTNLEGFAETVDENAQVWMLKLVPNALQNHNAQFYNSKTSISDNNICTNSGSAKLNLRITIPPGYVDFSGITIKYFKNNNLISQLNLGNSGYTGDYGKSVYSSLNVPDNLAYGNGTYKAKVTYSFSGTSNGNYSQKNVQSNNVNVAFSCGARLAGADNPMENNFSVRVFPNLISTTANISFTLNESQNVSFQIFDINGRLLSTLADKIFEEGEHQIKFNAEKMNAGIYFLKVQADEFMQTEKLIVTK